VLDGKNEIMELRGNITLDDHLNVKSMMKYDTGITNYIIYGGLLIIGLFAMILGYIVDDEGGLMAAFYSFCLICVLYLPYYKILLWYGLKVFKRNAEIHNIGLGIYKIDDDCIHFIGTTFNCDIPFKSIKSVVILNGTGYIAFGNYCGFIVPKDSQGKLSEFIDCVKNRISV